MYILNNLARRKLRSTLAVIGIAVGIGAYVSLVSISEGFMVTLGRIARFGTPDLIVQSREVVDPILSVVPRESLARLEADPRIRSVDTYASKVVSLKSQPFFLIFGLADGGETLRSCHIDEGAAPAPQAAEVLLGKMAAQRLSLGIGDSFRTPAGDVVVSGIFSCPNPLLSGSAVTPSSIHQRLFPDRPLAQLALVHLAEGASISAVRTWIDSSFPALIAIEPGLFTDAYPQLELSHDLARAVSWIACLAAAIGVLNTMMMNVMERTREIGTLLAIGWTRSRILRVVLLEGIALALVGGLLGLGLGYLGAELTVGLMEQALVTTRFQPALFVEGIVLAGFLGALGTLAPALRAARLCPTEALRYE